MLIVFVFREISLAMRNDLFFTLLLFSEHCNDAQCTECPRFQSLRWHAAEQYDATSNVF